MRELGARSGHLGHRGGRSPRTAKGDMGCTEDAAEVNLGWPSLSRNVHFPRGAQSQS